MNLIHCQKQLERHQHILNQIKFRLVKMIFIKPLRFVKTHEDVSKNRSQRRTHGYSTNLVIKLTVKNKMSLWCSEKEKFFKFFCSDFSTRIRIENEIYCYVNDFLKENIGKETSYMVENKKFFGNICILDLKNKKTYLCKKNH